LQNLLPFLPKVALFFYNVTWKQRQAKPSTYEKFGWSEKKMMHHDESDPETNQIAEERNEKSTCVLPMSSEMKTLQICRKPKSIV